MCSIIGYLGNIGASQMLVKGLKRMEYRGYDSVGIATSHDKHIEVRKGVGKVTEVDTSQKLQTLVGNVGIGHTRWATHGVVNTVNAHPHTSSKGQIAIVHNGIIDNYGELKQTLEGLGYAFKSQTDSEAISNLLQFSYDKTKDITRSMIETVAGLKGEYSFVAIFEGGILAAARFHEPLVVGLGKTGYFVSSDVLGFVEHTDEVIYPDNGEIVLIRPSGLQFFDFSGNPTKHQITKVSKEFADAYKGEYAHFTIKEINEQPKCVIKAGENNLNEIVDLLRGSKSVYLTGSGTSYHAALVAKHLFLKYGKIRLEPIISSESRFYPDYFDDQSLLIALSQSG
ncbi:MAG: glutamine--fructose-6-phosphate transaminase (isomerizing), partial [Patescibacteria group bacterium]|nr:glutamine--fructose-6-phosphate transaminase (isomerizing) [Patescibacteria group bacterium]